MTKKLSFSSGLLALVAIANYIWAISVIVTTAKKIAEMNEMAADLGRSASEAATRSALGEGLLAASVPALIGTVALVGFAVVSRLDDILRERTPKPQ